MDKDFYELETEIRQLTSEIERHHEKIEDQFFSTKFTIIAIFVFALIIIIPKII